MKRQILSFLFLTTVTCGALSQNDAMFVYRNDGIINAFLKSDIDSIRHSNLDLDSVMHAGYVTQEVWTEDSVYRIPIAAIDSVSFITPPTVYKNDVIRLDYNLLDYVIGADGLTLKLRKDTPAMLLPVNGSKLVFLDGCDALPNGFSGIVASVEQGSTSIDVICEQAYLEDLFDSFCSVSTVYGDNPDDVANASHAVSADGSRRIAYRPQDIVIPLGPYKYSCSDEISQKLIPKSDLSLNGGTNISVETKPKFKIHTFLILGDNQGVYFQCSITGNIEISTQVSLYGGLSFNHDYDKAICKFPIPQTGGLVSFYINPGLFVRASATIASNVTTTHNYTFGMGFDYSSDGLNQAKPSLGGRLASSSVDIEGCLEGSLATGGYIETGFMLVSREIARVCARGEIGYQFSGNFVLLNSDIEEASENTKLYKRLEASSLEWSRFVNVGLYSSVLGSEASLKWEASETEQKFDLVPTFSNTKLTQTQNSKTSVDAYTELRGNCLLPLKVGYKLLDGDNNVVRDFDANGYYFKRLVAMKYTFSGLDENKILDYVVCPKVNFFGHDILASPGARIGNPLLGSWMWYSEWELGYDSNTWTFYEDGTLKWEFDDMANGEHFYDSGICTYILNGNELTIIGDGESDTCTFKIEGDKLYFYWDDTDEDDIWYRK